MTSISHGLQLQDDPSCPDTASASQTRLTSKISMGQLDSIALRNSDSDSVCSSRNSHDLNSLLPIPSLPANKLLTTLTLSDVIENVDTSDFLTDELAATDVSIAADGSFIELASGTAARELKRRWDLRLGVGMSVRSPFAITAFVNQHGKQMYRVGRRELSAPAANAAEVEERVSQSTSPTDSSGSPKGTHRSRMSAHGFPSVFKHNGSLSAGARLHGAVLQPQLSRKLRKAQSNSDMFGPDSRSPSQNSTNAGRVHSRSVTGADVAPFTTISCPRHPGPDFFAEVMDWSAPPQTPSSSYSTTSLESSQLAFNDDCDQIKSYGRIAHPFGQGVAFNAPIRKPITYESLQLPLPRFLREMQSFESGLTARQADAPRRAENDSPIAFESNPGSPDFDYPPTELHSPGMSVSPGVSTPPLQQGASMSSLETALLSQYSADVFDVLQTYRGLPLLDKLPLEAEPMTVKMSLSADESAAPRDDPRFVIWGESIPERDSDADSISPHDSATDLSVHSSMSSRKRIRHSKTQDSPLVWISNMAGTQRVLLAATIERWIAQLTSDLNYDELLDFFLTYRTYIDSVELCRLLICRFHWALQQTSSIHDEKVRRIVRVRTFVAIRYWILTFFTVDFLPKRELRLLLANWLNALIRDPILKERSDGLGIVRKLIKVAKECKRAHAPCHSKLQSRRSVEQPKHFSPKPHVLGEKFAAATRKSVEEEESDLDLDFIPDEGTASRDIPHFTHDPANAHLTAHVAGVNVPSALSLSTVPLSSLPILQRADHSPGVGSEAEQPVLHSAPATLPIHHNVISRAFVRTIGRLGRWKRVLNSRSMTRTSLGACADVSAFDLELNASRDFLTISGGVEQYLKAVKPVAHSASAVTKSPDIHHSVDKKTFPRSSLVTCSDMYFHVRNAPQPAPTTVAVPVASSLSTSEPHETRLSEDSAVSFRSSSTESFGRPLGESDEAPPFLHTGSSQWQFDIVSVDDLELSDTSSDHDTPAAPPGLRRLPRKLPLRRDFEFVRKSDSVSSMGIISRGSLPSNTSSVASSTSVGGLGPNVARWQLTALVDSLSDDEEKGNVEDALKRLEGQINVEKQQEKASKVDGWVRNIRERMAAGDYDEDSTFSDDEEEVCDEDDAIEEVERKNYLNLDRSGADSFPDSMPSPTTPSALNTESPKRNGRSAVDSQSTPVPEHTPYPPPKVASDLLSSQKSVLNSRPDPAIPIEILQSRVPSRPTTADHSQRTSFSRFATASNNETRRVHRSFVLNYRASTLAEHYAMIDRELFMGVKFEELVLDDWTGCKEVNVLDWAQFLKDRARWKAEGRFSDKTSALAALRGRFNLMSSFIVSEVVLTPPQERPVLVAKLIRIAWKSYLMSSFNTLVAIITGLNSDWVAKSMKRSTWNRVGIWENRMLKDLRLFASHSEDFKHIRQVVASIVDVKPLDITSRSPSVASVGPTDVPPTKVKVPPERSVVPSGPSACIPFIGMYLSQLCRLSRMPDLIDPTAPDEPVGINPETMNFESPAHPEVFSALAPLPESMNLEPLINVHKQRKIARVIKSLVAGQHLASRVHCDLDKKLFQKCLRLRGLNSEMLERAFEMYERS